MKNASRKSGFTLTEVMLSAGILAIGFVLIAGAFPVGAKLTATATERSIAAVTADEAFAKIQLYGLDMNAWNTYYAYNTLPVDRGLTYGNCFDYSNIARLKSTILPLLSNFPPADTHEEYYYPTTNIVPLEEKRYHWSALCKRVTAEPTKVLITVFVSRLGGVNLKYPANPIPTADIEPGNLLAVPPIKPDPAWESPPNMLRDFPEPFMVQGVDRDPVYKDRLAIPGDSAVFPGDPLDYPGDFRTYFREGAKIFDDITGDIYTIQERLDGGATIVLDRDWPYADFTIDASLENVWVIPSAISGTGATTPYQLTGRWPCVGIFQRIIEF